MKNILTLKKRDCLHKIEYYGLHENMLKYIREGLSDKTITLEEISTAIKNKSENLNNIK